MHEDSQIFIQGSIYSRIRTHCLWLVAQLRAMCDSIHAELIGEVNIVNTMVYTMFIRVNTHHKEFYYPLD